MKKNYNVLCQFSPTPIGEADVVRRKLLRHSWFTLVELLIVVAIIAILISILLPALGKAKGMAHEICCKSQIKQLYGGWLGYVDDNNDFLPNSSSLEWNRNISELYLGKKKYFGLNWMRCPSGLPVTVQNYTYGVHSAHKATYFDYAPFVISSAGIHKKLYRIDSSCFLLADSISANIYNKYDVSWQTDSDGDGINDYNSSWNNYLGYMSLIHRKGANMIFPDGSARRLNLKTIVTDNPLWGERS